jgi:hypothetical protein
VLVRWWKVDFLRLNVVYFLNIEDVTMNTLMTFGLLIKNNNKVSDKNRLHILIKKLRK